MNHTLDYGDIEKNYESSHLYYMSMAINDKHIFAPYIDRVALGENNPWETNVLHVFDWDGTPVYKIQLSKKISFITLDPKYNILYAQGEDDSIWAYDVSWLSK